MVQKSSVSADLQIIEAYHQTTSARSGPVGKVLLERSAAGLRRRLRGWLPAAHHRVLDLGCGTGSLLYLCEKIGCSSLTGVNLCSEELDLARKNVSGSFHNSDLVKFLRDTPEVWDWIGCFNILEHLTKDEVLETLQLCSERLRPGGSVVIMVPNALSPFSGVTRYWDFTHKLSFAPNNFRQLLPLCGFADVEFRECGPVPYGLVSSARYLLWQLVRQTIRVRLMIEVADSKSGVYSMDMLVRLTKSPASS